MNIELVYGNTYHFIGDDKNKMSFIGKQGVWNQFVSISTGKVWSELKDEDLHMIQEV